jgi:uncharacterized membrane protein YjfL (UPF0719 family)
MILQSLAGLPMFLAYFCTAFAAVIIYLFVYTLITPHDEFALIRANVSGAAIALGLSLLGFALPLASVIAHTENLIDCMIWSLIALVVQVCLGHCSRNLSSSESPVVFRPTSAEVAIAHSPFGVIGIEHPLTNLQGHDHSGFT